MITLRATDLVLSELLITFNRENSFHRFPNGLHSLANLHRCALIILVKSAS